MHAVQDMPMDSEHHIGTSSSAAWLRRYWIYLTAGFVLFAVATTLTIVLVMGKGGGKHANDQPATRPLASNSLARDAIAKYRRYPKDCSRAPINPEDRRARKNSRVTFANYNVEWLFLFAEDYNCPGPGCTLATVDEAWNHYLDVEDTIKSTLLEADIIHLTEVEDCRMLEMLVERLPAGHGYKAYLVPSPPGGFGQNVGMLTRIDPRVDLRHVKGEMNYPVRGSTIRTNASGRETFTKNYMTELRFLAAGRMVHLLLTGLHMTAGPQDAAKSVRREAQAALTANAITAWHRSNPQGCIVTLGDFNDFDSALSVDGKDVPISRVLPFLLNSGPGLTNVMSRIAANRRRTHKSGSVLDHILTSSSKISNARVIHTPKLRRKRVSDHRPTIAAIDF